MDRLEALQHLLSHLPLQLVAGGLVPVLQFAQHKLHMRQAEQRRQQLQARLVALNSFISSVGDVPCEHVCRTPCLDDALHERDKVLEELASSIARKAARSKRTPSPNRLHWLFLLYHPVRPIGWALRWSFFALVIVTFAGTVRALFHQNYVPLRILVPFLITSFALAVLVRITAFYMERETPVREA
jgi:hypothetical protein